MWNPASSLALPHSALHLVTVPPDPAFARLSHLNPGEYAIGQRLRVTLSSLRNRLEGEEKKHLCKPTAEDRRKLYNGDNKLIAASLQRFIDRAREAGEEGPGKNVKDNGTSAGGSAEGKAHKKQRLV